MLSFIRCSLPCSHQQEGYCTVCTASSVVNSEDIGCIYYEPLKTDKMNKKNIVNLSGSIDKNLQK